MATVSAASPHALIPSYSPPGETSGVRAVGDGQFLRRPVKLVQAFPLSGYEFWQPRRGPSLNSVAIGGSNAGGADCGRSHDCHAADYLVADVDRKAAVASSRSRRTE